MRRARWDDNAAQVKPGSTGKSKYFRYLEEGLAWNRVDAGDPARVKPAPSRFQSADAESAIPDSRPSDNAPTHTRQMR